MKKWKKILTVLVSVSLLILALVFYGGRQVADQLLEFPLQAVIGALLVFGVNLLVVSFRYWRMLCHFGIKIPWITALRSNIAGYLSGLVMISLVGQVLGRQTVFRKLNIPSLLLSALSFYERAILASMSGVVCVLGAVSLIGGGEVALFFSQLPFIEFMIVGLCGCGLSAWLGRTHIERKMTQRLLTQHSARCLAEVSGITLLGIGCTLAAYVICILALRPDLGIMEVSAASAVICFAAMLPISVGGWGVREIASVFVLGRLGVPAEQAIAISIVVGLCSTAIVFAYVPVLWMKKSVPDVGRHVMPAPAEVRNLEVSAAWILGLTTAVLVFFQLLFSFEKGEMRLNLADPLALLSLAALLLHSIFSRRGPQWNIPRMNLWLIGASVFLLFGFLYGTTRIGVTSWALGNRLTGWVLLLGYASSGYFLSAFSGRKGVRRLIETFISVASMIVVFQVVIRSMPEIYQSWGGEVPLNFEGYAGNRNAFAFQLLVTLSLAFGLIPAYAMLPQRTKLRRGRMLVLSVMIGMLLAGLVWSGSRAGILTGVLLVCAGVLLRRGRKMWIMSLAWALIFWGLVVAAGQVSSSISSSPQVQSSFSGEYSDSVRRELVIYPFQLWRQHPVFGTGLGVFLATSTQWFAEPLVIHCTPLWILTEFGLVGFGFFASVFAVLFYHGWVSRRVPQNRALLALLFTFALFGLAHEVFYQRIFWLALGALAARPFSIQNREKMGAGAS